MPKAEPVAAPVQTPVATAEEVDILLILQIVWKMKKYLGKKKGNS